MGIVEIVWLTIAKFFAFGQLFISFIVGFEKPDYLT
jgi:multisubunit Na+/H+ antiporter MnhE subunit